ncbi:MAG: flagellar type III secretion system pore protein FliP, partial [Planctomycetia bacterium]
MTGSHRLACLTLLLAALAAEPARAEGDSPPLQAVGTTDRSTPTPADRSEPPTMPAVPAPLLTFLGTRSLDATLSAAVMFGVASLAPAVLLMTTSFVRMSIVLTLVRQGLGTPQLPSNQILTSLALFLSALVMWPVWTAAWHDGVEPYQKGQIDLPAAYERGTLPVRRWMATQIEQAGNRDTMLYFLARHPSAPKHVATYDEVPMETLLPA